MLVMKDAQMHGLCKPLVGSGYFCGAEFSGGDMMIEKCANYGTVKGKVFVGNPTSWVAIDTAHHMTYVTQEVVECEKALSTATHFHSTIKGER
ncbi:TPA: hypothetical protein ACPJ2D_004237 [Vibrio alginolyticus]